MTQKRPSWPVMLAIVVFALDQVGTTALVTLGVRGVSFIILSIGIGVFAVSYGYWFIGWFGRDIKESESARQTAREFKEAGHLGQVTDLWKQSTSTVDDIWTWGVQRLHDQLGVRGRLKRRLLAGALTFIRRTHVWMAYPIIIGFGLVPLGWILGVIVCRAYPVRGGLAVLMACNCIKAYYTCSVILAGLRATGL